MVDDLDDLDFLTDALLGSGPSPFATHTVSRPVSPAPVQMEAIDLDFW
jgi:hypothetical protein